jgi:hypothetical protein
MVDHVWRAHPNNKSYLVLQGSRNALVRTIALPSGRYLWQFRNVSGAANTLRGALDCVEAGAEFFEVFRRNPWG